VKRLRELARLHSIFPSYLDVWGSVRVAPETTILSLLSTRGIEVRNDAEVASEIARVKSEAVEQVTEPVQVHWLRGSRARPSILVRADCAALEIDLEDARGESLRVRLTLERGRYVFPRPLPIGYYEIAFELNGTQHGTMLIVAPVRGYELSERAWGVFVPPYAPRRGDDWGAGDVSHLEAIGEWVKSAGGKYVATLPMGPTFLAPGCHEVSPYAGISRLLWSELYIDIDQAPLIDESPHARELLARPAFRESLAALREGNLVDHCAVMRKKREVLSAAALDVFDSERLTSIIMAEAAKHPHWVPYSRFRATHELHGRGWNEWPEQARVLAPSDHPIAREYLLAQFCISTQMHRLQSAGTSLYLDFPLGTHSDGYDSWAHRELFMHTASAGAPPDHSYAQGQSWGFPPIDPDAIRSDHYRYVRASVRHHLSVASMLRVDHVMGLHRLYTVPAHMPPTAGAYVRYRAEEFYAVLTVESHRAKSIIIGEDLGTVPAYVRKSIDRHRFRRLFVVQRRLVQKMPDPPGEPISNMVGTLNTHDMYPFKAFWEGSDIEDRTDIGLLTEESAAVDRIRRSLAREQLLSFLAARSGVKLEGPGNELPDPENPKADNGDSAAVMDHTMQFLGRSNAAVILLNLEDLWLEEKPQNVPTTTWQRPNWRRRLRMTNEEMFADVEVGRRLEAMNESRQEKV